MSIGGCLQAPLTISLGRLLSARARAHTRDQKNRAVLRVMMVIMVG